MDPSTAGPGRALPTGPAAPVAGPGEATPGRVIPVEAGQILRATVAGLPGNGRVLLGLLGGTVEARSHLPLEVGKSYEFTVARTGPPVVLSTARPLQVPGARVATAQGLLGPPPAMVQALPGLLATLAGATAGEAVSTGTGENPAPDTTPREAARLIERLARGTVRGDDLHRLHRILGHDQEARVLRLPKLPEAQRRAEAVQLRQTMKAGALRLLEAPAETGATRDAVRAAARELVQGFSNVERDNAARADQSGPLWFPLPAQGPVRDARMFLLQQQAGDEAAEAGARPYTVVLLLDLTRLGSVRVDLEVRQQSVSATFIAVQPSTVQALVGGLEALRSGLGENGLDVRGLSVRPSPGPELPVADLVRHRPAGSSDTMVDVHV